MKRLTAVLVVVSCLLACSIYISICLTVTQPHDEWHTLVLMKNESIIRCTYDCCGLLVEGHYDTASPGSINKNTRYSSIPYHNGLTEDLPEPDPIRIGLHFAYFTGWYLDRECTTAYDPSSPLTSNVTVYAGWRIYDIIPYESK